MILSIIFLLPISLIILKYFFLFLLLSCSPKGSIKYNNGKFNCNICCCNENNSCYNDSCSSKCSKCNLTYLCCEPCTSKIFECFIGLYKNQNYD